MSYVQPTYPTNLKCNEWQAITELLPKKQRRGHGKWSLRLIANAILYVVRSGCCPTAFRPGRQFTACPGYLGSSKIDAGGVFVLTASGSLSENSGRKRS